MIKTFLAPPFFKRWKKLKYFFILYKNHTTTIKARMNSQKTYASAVKNGSIKNGGIKNGKSMTETDKRETDKRETDKRETDKQETDKQETDKQESYCQCCRKIVKAIEFNGKIVKAVEFKEWCNMFMCDDCENWIMAHGV